MSPFFFPLALGAIFLAAVGALALGCGEVRRALHLALARRVRLFAPKIVVAGDSLAACCRFAPLCRRPFGVLSLARGGATLKEVAGQLQQAQDVHARWIVMDGGLNDLIADGATPARLAEDFAALLRRLPREPAAVFTLPPFTADAGLNLRIASANAELAKLCLGAGVLALDLNPKIAPGGVRLPQMTDDGLHFSSAANAVWLAALRPVVAP
ncbi:MAG TPA: GDSL-type esterase/lipase family protein [Methylocystis sp.]|nr:GDSL-type esterase/lipase family protein [Methylocystis sp.]